MPKRVYCSRICSVTSQWTRTVMESIRIQCLPHSRQRVGKRGRRVRTMDATSLGRTLRGRPRSEVPTVWRWIGAVAAIRYPRKSSSNRNMAWVYSIYIFDTWSSIFMSVLCLSVSLSHLLCVYCNCLLYFLFAFLLSSPLLCVCVPCVFLFYDLLLIELTEHFVRAPSENQNDSSNDDERRFWPIR